MTSATDRARFVAHDEHLLELLWAAAKAEQALDTQQRYTIAQAAAIAETGFVGRSVKGLGFTYYHPTTPEDRWGDQQVTISEALEWLQRQADGETFTPARGYYWGYGDEGGSRKATERIADYRSAMQAFSAARTAIEAHEDAYTGWSRFFLVTSSAGHVHSSMDCTSCYWSTRFAPVPSLSGSTEAEAVSALGETLCTVCFPSAPVKPSKVTEAQARKLLEEGEDAFIAARTKYLTKKGS